MEPPFQFDAISSSYDRVNCFISLGMNKSWHRKMIRQVEKNNPQLLLDVACGTGVLTFKLARQTNKQVSGLDPSKGMLSVAREKLSDLKKRHVRINVDFVEGFAENLPYKDHSFDAVTISYGLRNFADKPKALAESFRVLKDDGALYILEFSAMPSRFWNGPQRFYLHYILPRLGSLLSGNKQGYLYLRNTIEHFPQPSAVCHMLEEAQFSKVSVHRFFPGVAFLYTAKK